MSPFLTFRQKIIRVGCSAAVCGLSFSFMIGEVVDREAKLLRDWTIDPAILPVEFLPTRPLNAALEKMETPAWRENLVALNSLPSSPPSISSASTVLVAVYSEKDSLKIVNSASEKPLLPTKVDQDLLPTEVEVILASIHSATAKLASPTISSKNAETAPEVSKTQEPKVLPPPAPRRTIPREQIARSEPPKPAVVPKGSSDFWSISGSILSSTSQNAEAGHYEVGLFSKIDPEGKPFGSLLRQQILPEGQSNFRMEVPASVEKGYLFAEFVAAKAGKRTLIMPSENPWVQGSRKLAELYHRAEDTVASVSSAAALSSAGSIRAQSQDTWKIQGSVSTMFVGSASRVAQADVVVKVRGRKEATRTDRSGNFSIELPKLRGTLFIEVLKAGYHPSVMSISAEDTRPIHLEISSRHAIDQVSQRLGAGQGSTKGIFVGRFVAANGSGIRGMTAQLSIKADGPFYFDEDGIATRDAKATSGNGKFLFLNVESGTGFLESSINSEAIAPLQISMIEGGELIQKSLTPVSGSMKGRIFDPVTAGGKLTPVGGARVRLDGASDWVTTDSFGAFSIGPLKWFSGERIALDVSAEKFNNHRYMVRPEQSAEPLSLFAFPASYVARLARSMDIDLDPYSGLIVGKVSGASLRMDALADHSAVNNAKDFYFDAKGRLRGSHEMTDPRFGTFIIFNVPKGRTLLQGNDSSGVLRYSDSVFANPASINVQMD